jgi:hypothetical protein
MSNYYDSINHIRNIMRALVVPCQMYPCYEGYMIRFPWCRGDIAMHAGTYGSKDGYVETYQFPWDGDDVTVLTVEEAARKVIAYYENWLEGGE